MKKILYVLVDEFGKVHAMTISLSKVMAIAKTIKNVKLKIEKTILP
ncbi:MAG: hypothetical protein WC827_04045 [Candidatus Paceibacterota bacterium]|jgi:hypothetical protein